MYIMYSRTYFHSIHCLKGMLSTVNLCKYDVVLYAVLRKVSGSKYMHITKQFFKCRFTVKLQTICAVPTPTVMVINVDYLGQCTPI